MGIEHALICKKCKTWVDGHKNWGAYFAVHEQKVPSWEEVKSGDRPHFDIYWTYKMFAFLWKHKDHGSEVVWEQDTTDEFLVLTENALEEFKN